MKKVSNDIKWMVWNWNFNRDELEEYDVMPRFIRAYKDLKKKDRPTDIPSLDKWLDEEASYNFWSKCEYEMIIHDWPKGKNDQKVDIYKQLKLNWNVFVRYFWDNVVMKGDHTNG